MDKDIEIKEILKLIGVGRSSFYDSFIDNVCSTYDINKSRFKKAEEKKSDIEKDDEKYCFKKEWADLALLLLERYKNNPYYRGNVRAKGVSIDKVTKYYEKYIEKINALPDEQKLEIQLHPVYIDTIKEIAYQKVISDKMQLLFSTLTKVPVSVRVNMLEKLEQQVDMLVIEGYYEKLTAEENIKAGKGKLLKDQVYENYDSIDYLVAGVLKKLMDKHFKGQYNIHEENYESNSVIVDALNRCFSPEITSQYNMIEEVQNYDDELEELIFEEVRNSVKKYLRKERKHIKPKTLDDRIKEMINATPENDRSKKDRMELAGEMAKDAFEEINKYKDDVENIIKETNYAITNRRSDVIG